jgi:ABC-2 type transport system ATP-binding protein
VQKRQGKSDSRIVQSKLQIFYETGLGNRELEMSLEVIGLTKRYGSFFPIKNLKFSVDSGEILGYLGANGAGKTTTMKIMAGMLRPTSGEVLWQGKNIVHGLDEYKKDIGYVPENCELYGYLSPCEYLQLVGRLRLIKENVLQKKIHELLSAFGLNLETHQPLSHFSKGMKQKVLILSALLHNPKILLLDEPLSGLDMDSTLLIRELIQCFAAEGKIIVFSCHVLEVVEKICTRVLIIRKGEQVLDESIANFGLLKSSHSLENTFKELTCTMDHRAIAQEVLAIVHS